MKQVPARMQPKHGGQPLPWPPILIPAIDGLQRMHLEAAKYANVLQSELDLEVPKWSGSQRQYIRREVAKWTMRAQGHDAHFEKHGTCLRPMNSEPPGWAEWHQARLRRKEEARTGIRVSAARQRRMQRMPTVQDVVKRLQKLHGTKKQEQED